MREVYEVDDEHLLLVASDRVSAFDVVLNEPIPHKGAVLTQISAFWFERLANVFPSHYVTARTAEIVRRIPALAGLEREIAGRACSRGARRRSCSNVVRGYLAGSAWAEYEERGTLAGESLAPGLIESSRLDPPLFSPATKAESGHDLNVTLAAMADVLGRAAASGSATPASPFTRRDAITRRRTASSWPIPNSSSARSRTATSCSSTKS